MSRIFSKIDPLLGVILAILGLFLVFSVRIQKSFQGDKVVLKKIEALSDIVQLPDSLHSSIFAFDKQFNLYYSTNGGDNYTQTNQISASDLVFSKLGKYATSYRSKPYYGEQPTLPSFLLKAKHEGKDIYAEPQMVTFFTDYDHTLPVLSIISGEGGLFSEIKGVLALGQDSWTNTNLYKPFWNLDANYQRRGGKSKRKAYWQYFKNSNIVFESEADLQVSGNATRSFAQKSFKLKANRLYGNNLFKYQFFGKKGLKKYSSLVVRNSGNDNMNTLFADLIMHDLAKKTKVIVQLGKPIVLYLNGNYWGIYNLRERIDVHMIAEKENAKASDITILEGGAGVLKEGNPQEAQQFHNMVSKLSFPSEIINYESIANLIDIASFIDYIVLETFFGNGDWLHNNALWYKEKGEKWRWILNDLDYALTYLGPENIEKNYFKYLAANKTLNAQLFNFLICNNSFKDKLKKRVVELFANNLSANKIDQKFKKYVEKIRPELTKHIDRWTGVLTINKWEKQVESNRDFLHNRKEIFLKQLDNL